jgi:hypothetical protein
MVSFGAVTIEGEHPIYSDRKYHLTTENGETAEDEETLALKGSGRRGKLVSKQVEFNKAKEVSNEY